MRRLSKLVNSCSGFIFEDIFALIYFFSEFTCENKFLMMVSPWDIFAKNTLIRIQLFMLIVKHLLRSPSGSAIKWLQKVKLVINYES